MISSFSFFLANLKNNDELTNFILEISWELLVLGYKF